MFSHGCLIRRAISLAVLALLASGNAYAADYPLLTSGAIAQSSAFPSRPLRFVVPFPPGAGADVIARLIAQPLSERIGKPVVVDNRTGAAGIIGASIVAKAIPDGHTALLITATFAIGAAFYNDLPYNAVSDFAAVARVAAGPLAVIVHPSVPAHSVKDFIALAQSRPGKLNYASGGPGGINHLAAEMLKSAASINVVEVPYKGGGPALTAVISGEVNFMVATLGSCLTQIRAGRVRALALGSKRRSMLLPELPTVIESGVPGYEAETWYAVVVPRGTAAARIQVLSQSIIASLQTQNVTENLAASGFESSPLTADHFATYLKSEIAKWARVIKDAGITRS
jgi:tripartite-type tricarboxylate transporter receptor subunit TctC